MKIETIPPLVAISLDRWNGGFANDIYFTFTHRKDRFYVNQSTFRARIRITGGETEAILATQLQSVAQKGDAAAVVAKKLRECPAPLHWQNHINDVANQIEAGKGNHTRRVDQLFED